MNPSGYLRLSETLHQDKIASHVMGITVANGHFVVVYAYNGVWQRRGLKSPDGESFEIGCTLAPRLATPLFTSVRSGRQHNLKTDQHNLKPNR